MTPTVIELIELASNRLFEQAIDSYMALMADIGFPVSRDEAIAWLTAPEPAD